ncbi:MAG: restriction endonuclease subunit S [Candidatus Micrarchaeaceae archaeon]
MSVTSVVRLSELEGTKRLDAEYYQPEYLRIAKKLKSCKPIKNFVGAIIRPSSIKREYSENGYLFMLTQNIKENYLDFSEKFYISSQIAKQIPKNLLQEGDIVTVGTGNIGLSATIPKLKEYIYASPDIIILRDSKISPFYISTYLNSKIGKLFLNRIIYGISQPHITAELLGRIPVPVLSKENINKISNMVENALNMLRQSEYSYSQAESILLSELDLQNFKPEDKLCYTVNLSKVNTSHRIDAEYFDPKYDEVIEKVNKGAKLKALKEFIISVEEGIEVGSEKYQKEGIPFIRVSNLSISGLTDKDQKYISEKDYQFMKNKFEPKEGEILLTKDATPGVSYFVKEPIRGIISSGILRLKVKNINPEYLSLCINSIVGKLQIGKDSGGSVITHWKLKQIKNILIPILHKEIQQEIAKLVRQSHDARKKAKELLEKSEKIIEYAIG